jgi:hypothetical protein
MLLLDHRDESEEGAAVDIYRVHVGTGRS